MNTSSKIILTQTDFERLSSLVTVLQSGTDLLEEELNRATVVPADEFPGDVVSMNSIVNFMDLDTGKQSIVTLVYPHDSNIEESKISVLAPVGSALIGLRAGEVIRWPLPNGKERTLKVISVLYQPDAA